MIRELFEMVRCKIVCMIFLDETDAISGQRFDDGDGGDNEIQTTMLELINQFVIRVHRKIATEKDFLEAVKIRSLKI